MASRTLKSISLHWRDYTDTLPWAQFDQKLHCLQQWSGHTPCAVRALHQQRSPQPDTNKENHAPQSLIQSQIIWKNLLSRPTAGLSAFMQSDAL